MKKRFYIYKYSFLGLVFIRIMTREYKIKPYNPCNQRFNTSSIVKMHHLTYILNFNHLYAPGIKYKYRNLV